MPKLSNRRVIAATRGANRVKEREHLKIKTDEEEEFEAELRRIVEEEGDEETKRVLLHTVVSDVVDIRRRKVARKSVEDYLRREKQKVDNCVQLPCSLAFFATFALAGLLHEDVSNAGQLERQWRNSLSGTTFEGLGPPISKLKTSGHKDMGDIDLVVDVWNFLQEALLPSLLPERPMELRRSGDVYRVARYNCLIGGVQLQQVRRTRRDCSAVYPNMGPKEAESDYNPVLSGVSCFPWDDYADGCYGPGSVREGFCPDSRLLGVPARRLNGSAGGWARRLQFGHDRHARFVEGNIGEGVRGGGGFTGGTYTVMLHPHEGLETSLKKLQELRNERWIDEGTAWFGVKLFALNPDLALYCHVIASVFLSPSGELLPSIELTSFQAEPYQDRSRLAYDVIWLVLWLYLFGRCMEGLLRAALFESLWLYFVDFWNVIDWLSVLGGTVVIVNWVLFLTFLGDLKDRVGDVQAERPIAESGFDFDDGAHRERFVQRALLLHREASSFAGFVRYARVFACNYTLLIIVRFFKAFSVQPRLAIITTTLSSCLVDMGHFLCVLVLVMLVWGAGGMFLFGHRLLGFSSFGFTLNTCFLVMMGSYDFQELQAEHPVSSAVWFWSYYLLVSLILLNMALAIVLDVYMEVAANSSDTDYIWDQLRGIWKFWLVRNDWLSNSHVLNRIYSYQHCPDGMDVEDLCIACPEMVQGQAMELIKGAEHLENQQADRGLQMSDALRMTAQIREQVDEMAFQIEDFCEAHARYAEERRLVAARPPQPLRLLDFSPEAKERLECLSQRFQRMEELAKESMHSAVEASRELKGQLAGVESFLFGAAGPPPRDSGWPPGAGGRRSPGPATPSSEASWPPLVGRAHSPGEAPWRRAKKVVPRRISL